MKRIRLGNRWLTPLTEAQQELVVAHLHLCRWVDDKFVARRSHLRAHNTPSEILDTAAEDALLMAAYDYSSDKGAFSTWFVYKYSQYLSYLDYTYKAEERTPTNRAYTDRERHLKDRGEEHYQQLEREAEAVRAQLPEELRYVFDAPMSVVARTQGITTQQVRIRRQTARRILVAAGIIT